MELTLLHGEKDRARVSCLLKELGDSRQKLLGKNGNRIVSSKQPCLAIL